MTTTDIQAATQATIDDYLAKTAPALLSKKLRRTYQSPISATALAWVGTVAVVLGGGCWLIDTVRIAVGG